MLIECLMLFKCVLINCVIPWEIYIHVIKVKIHTLRSGYCYYYVMVMVILICLSVCLLRKYRIRQRRNCFSRL